MSRITRWSFGAMLLVVLYGGTAVPPVVANADGRLGECIQLCSFLHELCMENWVQYCLEFEPYRTGQCIGKHMPECNRTAVDCKVGYCLGGGLEPLRVLPRRGEQPGLPGFVE